jgi:hypothetical protein
VWLTSLVFFYEITANSLSIIRLCFYWQSGSFIALSTSIKMLNLAKS